MTQSPSELDALLARIALRDRTAFAALYRETAPKVLGICLSILKDRAEAEDAVQDIFVRLWHTADRYRPDLGTPLAWISTIARNRAIDLLRMRKPGEEDTGALEQLAADAECPEQSAIRSSEGRRIDLCLAALDPPRDQAVRRAYIQGETYAELARHFDVPLNTMRSWLRRSLLQLRECLSQ